MENSRRQNIISCVLLCRYRKRTDIYYSTWSLENVSESCQFQYFRHPPPQKQTLTIFWGGVRNFFRPPPYEKLLVDISYNIPVPVNKILTDSFSKGGSTEIFIYPPEKLLVSVWGGGV